jgi:acyl dehydratase
MTLEELKRYAGREVGVTEWLEITQGRIDKFADATGDHQWIHTDCERAKRESPYEATIAHGFLTLSLLTKLFTETIQLDDVRMAINYGLNRVRFPSAVRAGTQIRARIVLHSTRDMGESTEAVYAITIEAEGSDKPCCVAEWIARYN